MSERKIPPHIEKWLDNVDEAIFKNESIFNNLKDAKIDWPKIEGGQFEVNFNDQIEHPKHYTQGIECADYIESHSMDFFQGNAVKYLTRFKHKGNPIEDLKKAKWYVERLIKKYSEKE